MRVNRDIGVMFWAGGDPVEMIKQITALGVRTGQLGVPGDLALGGQAAIWKKAAEDAQFRTTTVFAAYGGESYADILAVQSTVGFVPHGTRAAREERTREVSRFAHDLGVGGVATHIGFVPDDRSDPEYNSLIQTVQRICDYAGERNQTFALETGQESAEALLRFLQGVNRPNLGINFDPANMILYGTGNPVEALRVLGPHVLSVHCKDGDWPPANEPHALGQERSLGQGAVDFKRFLMELDKLGFRGPLNVEREYHDAAQRWADVKTGIAFLRNVQLSEG